LIFLLLNLLTFRPDISDSLVLTTHFGDFSRAASISVSREEFIFVSDIQTNKIYKYSREGESLAAFGGTGTGTEQLNNPAAIDASNGLDVFVADYQNNRIQRLDLRLRYVATFDFNIYNLTADIETQIYYPSGVAFLSTAEIFAIVDAGKTRLAKLRAFDEVTFLFGLPVGVDRVVSPMKIIKGPGLSIFVLDKELNEVLQFDNYGTYVERIKDPYSAPIISIAFYNDNLYILNSNSLISFDAKRKQFSGSYSYQTGIEKEMVDCTFLDKDNFLMLSKLRVFKFKIN
jgi:hypothetical protein